MHPLACSQPSGAAAALFMASISALKQLQCGIGDNSIYPADTVIKQEYDFIIIGAGGTGSVLASRLSENPNFSILLVEGGGDPPYTSEVPALSATLVNTPIDYGFVTKGNGDYCKGMVDKKCKFPRGKVLGGSSTLNSVIYWRGNPRDYDRWARDNPGWSYNDVRPFFNRAEGISDERAARADEEEAHLSVEPFDGGDLPLLTVLRQAVGERGYLIPSSPQKICSRGFYRTFGLLKDGTKSSAAKAYLPSLKGRPNVGLVRHATVKKINFASGRRVESVAIDVNGTPYTVNVKKELILSAGTIPTPQVLMISGIGPRKHLKHLSIPVVVDLPVGRNLQDHILFPGVVASIGRGNEPEEDLERQNIRDVVAFLLDRKGALSGVGYRQFTGFINAWHSKDTRDTGIQILFDVFKQGDFDRLNAFTAANNYNPEVTAEYELLVNQSDILIVSPAIMYPKSTGYLELASTDPAVPPTLVPNYFCDPKDVETMLSGIAEAMRILKTKALNDALRVEPRALLQSCLKRGRRRGSPSDGGKIDDSSIMTKKYWRCAMRTLSIPQNFAGTCRMGPSHKNSVVDHSLKVHRVKGLRIVDGSIMPSITTGDITGATVMIAEKAAKLIMHDWQ